MAASFGLKVNPEGMKGEDEEEEEEEAQTSTQTASEHTKIKT